MSDDPKLIPGDVVLYVGPERPDLPDQRGVVIEKKGNRWLVEFGIGRARLTVAESDIQLAPLGTANVEVSRQDSLPFQEVEPLIFGRWLVENTRLTEDDITLSVLESFFQNFIIVAREDS